MVPGAFRVACSYRRGWHWSADFVDRGPSGDWSRFSFARGIHRREAITTGADRTPVGESASCEQRWWAHAPSRGTRRSNLRRLQLGEARVVETIWRRAAYLDSARRHHVSSVRGPLHFQRAHLPDRSHSRRRRESLQKRARNDATSIAAVVLRLGWL